MKALLLRYFVGIFLLLFLLGCGEDETSTQSNNAKNILLVSEFGTNGVTSKEMGTNTFASIRGLSMDTYGNAYVLSDVRDDIGAKEHMELLKFNSNGAPDDTFAKQAVYASPIYTSSGSYIRASDLALYADEKNANALNIIIAASSSVRNNDDSFTDSTLTINLDARGKLKTSFAQNGMKSENLGVSTGQIMLDANHSIYEMGKNFALLSNNAPLVWKLNKDGVKDTSFGLNGELLFYNETSIKYGKMTFDNNGKIIIAGVQDLADGTHIVLIRYNSNAQLDKSFGNQGIAIDPRVFQECGIQNGLGITAVDVNSYNQIGIIGSRCPNQQVQRVALLYDANGSISARFNSQKGELTLANDSSKRLETWRDFHFDKNNNFNIVGDVFNFGSSHGQHMSVWKYSDLGSELGQYEDTKNDCLGSAIAFDNNDNPMIAGACTCASYQCNKITLWKLKRY